MTELRNCRGIWNAAGGCRAGTDHAQDPLAKIQQWLVSMNLAVLLGVFYITAPVDFAAVIARFNIENSRELGGTGASLDVHYLGSLGDGHTRHRSLLEHPRVLETGPDSRTTWELRRARDLLVFEFDERNMAWQSWTWRTQRLARYLAAHPAVEK